MRFPIIDWFAWLVIGSQAGPQRLAHFSLVTNSNV